MEEYAIKKIKLVAPNHKKQEKIVREYFDNMELGDFKDYCVVNLPKINKYLITFDEDYRKQVRLYLNTMFFSQDGNFPVNRRIVENFLLEFIGKGVTSSSFKVGDGLILKQTKENYYHELAVGFCLNKLIDEGILNYMYTFGGFGCKSTSPSKDNTHYNWCSKSINTPNFIVLQQIGGNSVEHTNLSKNQINSVRLQLLFALMTAHSRYNFSHNDLHIDNVLLFPTSIKFINYKIGNVEYTVKTFGILPVMIDYGYSFVTDQGVDFGHETDEINRKYIQTFGIFVDRPNIFKDLASVCTLMYTLEDPDDFIVQCILGKQTQRTLRKLNNRFPYYKEVNVYEIAETLAAKFKLWGYNKPEILSAHSLPVLEQQTFINLLDILCHLEKGSELYNDYKKFLNEQIKNKTEVYLEYLDRFNLGENISDSELIKETDKKIFKKFKLKFEENYKI